jgi:hypothetical protein
MDPEVLKKAIREVLEEELLKAETPEPEVQKNEQQKILDGDFSTPGGETEELLAKVGTFMEDGTPAVTFDTVQKLQKAQVEESERALIEWLKGKQAERR